MKSKTVAAVLAFFLGAYGAHEFYLGDKRKGIIRLAAALGCTILYYIMLVVLPVVGMIFGLGLTALGIWGFVDFIRILMGKVTDAEGNPLQ